MSEPAAFQRVALIGLGMMNASLAAALKKCDATIRVVGYARRQETRDAALAQGLVAEVFDQVTDAVREADLVILGTPVVVMADLLKEIAPMLKPGCVVTDQGSTKAWLVETLTPIASEAGAVFIGSHPMCGSEQQGLEAANAELFKGAPLILTPTASTSSVVVDRMKEFWSALGMRVLVMEAALHDELVAEVSHVPHLLSTALTLSVAQHPEAGKLLNEVCGSGFDCMTRMAAGSPDMWHDILKTNAAPIRAGLERLRGVCQEMEDLLEQREFDAVRDLLAQGVKDRSQFFGDIDE
jgi:prephenate dehydrogenase